MGSVGKGNSSVGVPLNADDYATFSNYSFKGWLDDPSNSNWSDFNLTWAENDALQRYTGGGYGVNWSLYKVPTDEMPKDDKELVQNIQSGLDKFELKNGIEVIRNSDFQMFGANPYQVTMSVEDVKNFLSKTDGVVQNDGFLSTSMDTKGVSNMGYTGFVLHLRIPPSKGAGAPIADISIYPEEKEFLVNSRAVLKFDMNSIQKRDDGKVHATAYWLGQAKKRTVDK